MPYLKDSFPCYSHNVRRKRQTRIKEEKKKNQVKSKVGQIAKVAQLVIIHHHAKAHLSIF